MKDSVGCRRCFFPLRHLDINFSHKVIHAEPQTCPQAARHGQQLVIATIDARKMEAYNNSDLGTIRAFAIRSSLRATLIPASREWPPQGK